MLLTPSPGLLLSAVPSALELWLRGVGGVRQPPGPFVVAQRGDSTEQASRARRRVLPRGRQRAIAFLCSNVSDTSKSWEPSALWVREASLEGSSTAKPTSWTVLGPSGTRGLAEALAPVQCSFSNKIKKLLAWPQPGWDWQGLCFAVERVWFGRSQETGTKATPVFPRCWQRGLALQLYQPHPGTGELVKSCPSLSF